MSNETQVEKILRLRKAQYSVRAIAKNVGISKSQVQRILDENKQDEPSQIVSQEELGTVSRPSQTVSQVSPKEFGTVPRPSQIVSQASQRELGTVSRPSQTVSQEIRDRQKEQLKTERELKEWERNFKNQFDEQLQIILIQKNFSLDELEEKIDFFSDGKENVDTLSHRIAEFTGDENFEFSNFLKDLLIYLRKAQIKMKTLKYKDLKKDRAFSFDKELRYVYEEEEDENEEEYEYDDDEEQEYEDDEDENSEAEEELCVVVKLWGKYDSTLKSQVQRMLNQEGLGFEW